MTLEDAPCFPSDPRPHSEAWEECPHRSIEYADDIAIVGYSQYRLQDNMQLLQKALAGNRAWLEMAEINYTGSELRDVAMVDYQGKGSYC